MFQQFNNLTIQPYLISVVMPVYNREAYLKEAIDSILNQSFRDFEFIIVDDGSTDSSPEIIRSYSDQKIKYVRLAENSGNTVARNIGIKAASGKYIAIMDSDDISVPERLKKQYDFLEKHPEIGILGGFKKMFTPEYWFLQHYPSNPNYIKSFLFFKNTMGQPTVMMRREIIDKNNLYYDPQLENMEDYDLWYRASTTGVKIANLDEVLLYYRLSLSQMSSHIDDRKEMLKDFFKRRLKTLDIELDENEFEVIHGFIRGRVEVDADKYKFIQSNLDRIEYNNRKKGLYPITAFKAAIFYFRLRLIKYYYKENKKDKMGFYRHFIILCYKTGINALQLFWINDGKYLNKSGRAHKHYELIK